MELLTPHDPFACNAHDHRRCQQDALAAAEAACARDGARLTPIRKRVLELVWASHKPMGAYALLEQLAGDGHRPAPPTIYRALEFLLEQGLVHRIDSLNAFVGCTHPGERHRTLFLICRACQRAQEIAAGAIERAVTGEAVQHGFWMEKLTLEVEGVCHACAEAGVSGGAVG